MDFDEATLRAIAQVYKEEGNAEYKKKEFRNAASFYTEGIDVKCKDDQLNAILYTNRATSYFCLGYFKEALQDARRAREFQPSYIKAIFRGAKASLELQQYDEAINWCDDGLAVEKENKALLEIKDKSVDAKMKLEKGYQNNVKKDHEEKVTDSYACHILAYAYFSAGNFERAIECFKEYLNICECKGDKIEKRKASTNLCNAYYKHGKYKLAIKYGQQSLALSKELGDRPGEGRENGRLGLLYELSNDLEKAIENFTVSMRICQEVGERHGERTACSHLGALCYKVSEFKKAKEYIEKSILIENELKDRAAEEHAWGNLGSVQVKLSNFKQAIECYNHCLVYSQEVGDRALEGSMYGNIGNACLGRGDFKEAMDYFKQSLAISKEVGDRAAEGRAYGNLGNAWTCLGNHKEAMQYHSKHLDICQELRDRLGEEIANTNLGIVHYSLRNLKEAIHFHKKSLMISQELKNKEGEGRAFGNLGNTYQSLCDFHRAFEYYNQSLEISKEIGDRAQEGTICGNLGCTLLFLCNVNKAIKYHNKHLAICNEVGDKAGEGRAYGNLSNAYRRLGKYSQAMNYHKKHLSIFKKLGDRDEEGKAYRNLGTILQHLGDFVQAKEYFNKQLVISKETGNRGGEEEAYLRLSFVSLCLDELSQAMEFSKQHLTICKATGNITGEGNAHLCQGYCSLALGFGSDAVVSFKSSVCCFNHVRSLLHTKDEWKISLRNEYRMAYTALCNVLLQLKRTEEALLATEKGRAQALVDLLVTKYGFDKHLLGQVSEKETVCELLTIAASNTVFLAVNLDEEVNVWLIQDGKHVHFIEPNHEAETSESDRGEDLDSLIKKTYKEIGVRSCVRCENRSLDALNCKNGVLQDDPNLLYLSLRKVLRSKRVDDSGNSDVSTPVQKKYLSVLYDIIFAPVVNRLCGNELIIVPDGPLFLVPFAALQDPESRYLCESFRIRVIPSLTCLKMILDVPPDHHCKSGALIVGDPWLQEIVNILGKPKLVQLPFARKEAEIIGRIVKTPPLIGSQATKEEVLRRLNSVALIHIAAHGRMETGEIALAPNTSRKSYIPSEEDFMLTMSDVLRVGLRARLVVLSCCYSGRGEIKDEGVVGIARAFLGAGARSVLVSLWAIEDEATLEFMRVFYEHLADGKTASEALNRATNHMRESQDFCHIRQWAPFVLIGDDVTLEFFQQRSTF